MITAETLILLAHCTVNLVARAVATVTVNFRAAQNENVPAQMNFIIFDMLTMNTVYWLIILVVNTCI